MKEVIASVLGIVMLFAVCFASFAEAPEDGPGEISSGDYSYVLKEDGTAVITAYTGTEKDLTVPSALDGHTVTGIGEEAFGYCESLTSIDIPDSVTQIGDGAFELCTSLTSFRIPNGVTDIGFGLFSSCESLTSVTIPDTVTRIGEMAFVGCSSLASIAIPDSVTRIESDAFYDCISLTSLVIPDSVTSIGEYAFGDCTSLKSINIPDSLTEIGTNPFAGCTSLGEVSVSPKHPVLELVDGVLFSKPDKRLISYPALHTAASYGIPDGTVSVDGSAFYGNNALTAVSIPNSVAEIGENPFVDCANLKDIRLASDNPAFEVVDGVLFGKTKKNLITYPSMLPADTYAIPDGTRSVGNTAFLNNNTLTSVSIPSSVAEIGIGAFFGCGSLTSVDIPEGVKEIGPIAFGACSSLTSVTLPGSITRLYYGVFSECEKITSVVLPASFADYETDDVFSELDIMLMFDDVSNITFTVPGGSDMEKLCEEAGVKYITK